MFHVIEKKTGEALIEGTFDECWAAFKGVAPQDRKGLVMKRIEEPTAAAKIIVKNSKALLTQDQKFNLGL